jgi:putative glycosyltransferase (TIGR04372 family)
MTDSLRKLAGMLFRAAVRLGLVFPVLPILYLIEPFYRIRVCTMYTQRLGHLAGNADILVRKLQLESAPPRSVFLIFGWDPCNRQLFDMWLRTVVPGVRFIESRIGTRIIFAWRPILTKTRFWQDHRIAGTEYYLYNHTKPVLSFTEEEERRGRALLAEMGIGPNDWFVCFHARDGAYFLKWRPELAEHWKQRDFRNVDIMRFLKAAEYIASRGGFALRFGAHVEKPLPDTGNPRIIDYSTKYRSDFMDIYLCAKCRFFIGCASGPDILPTAFNVPVLSAGHFPYNHSHYRQTDMIIPRLLRSPDGARLVGYWEAQEAGYYVGWKEADARDPNMHLFDMLDVDPDDIVDGCRDMIDALEGKAPSPAVREIQEYYAEKYLSHADGYRYAAKITPSFALKYRRLIIPGDDSSARLGGRRMEEART